MTALEIAKKIHEDTSHFSFSGRVFKHALWPDLKALGESALPDLFELLKEEGSPHVMAMIQGIADHAVEIPEGERGHVQKMVKRFMTWGRAKHFTK